MMMGGADLSKLKDYEVQMLMDFFMYHLQPDLRTKLMFDHPVLYNKVVGQEVMGVRQNNPGWTREPDSKDGPPFNKGVQT